MRLAWSARCLPSFFRMSCHGFALTRCHESSHFSVIRFPAAGAFAPAFLPNPSITNNRNLSKRYFAPIVKIIVFLSGMIVSHSCYMLECSYSKNLETPVQLLDIQVQSGNFQNSRPCMKCRLLLSNPANLIPAKE